MTSTSPEDLPRLLASLRRWLRSQDAGDRRLSHDQVRLLLDELGRLQQSNDRLRKQNRHLRARAAAEGPGNAAPDAMPPDPPDPPGAA